MPQSTADVIGHHLASFGAGDLDGLMEDYTADSVLMTPNGVLRGPDAIRELFAGMIAEFGKPGSSFEMLRHDVEGEACFLLWTAETADNAYELATDTFVVRDGKIALQSFAGKITPKG